MVDLADRLRKTGVLMGRMAAVMPIIADNCTTTPDIDADAEEGVSIRWARDGASFSLHFVASGIHCILSDPRGRFGDGWSVSVPVGGERALVDVMQRSSAAPFLRRYGSASAQAADNTEERGNG